MDGWNGCRDQGGLWKGCYDGWSPADSIRMTDDENEEDEEAPKQRKVGTKVGSSEVKYTARQTQMVRNMFEGFIAKKIQSLWG